MVTIQSPSLLNLQLNTQNLTLKPISLHDQVDLAKNFTYEICEYMDNVPFKNWLQTLAFVRFHLAQIEFEKCLTLTARKNNEFIGSICLSKINSKVPEFGIWVAKEHQNKGYGKEMIQAVYQWALDQNRFDYLLYPSVSINMASRKLAEFIGGHYLYHKQEIIGSHLRTVLYYHLPTTHDFTRN
jgi:[ribosomal protein S5]-alanine N-acetyltransferase